jgi:large conductance mechanosensitive channel
MNMLREFRAFIAKGNVLDLAVAVIIGASVRKIATSLTEDIIMPVVGLIFGGLDFSSQFTCSAGAGGISRQPQGLCALKAAGAPVLGWGEFVTVVINFLISLSSSSCSFRMATRIMRRSEEAAGPTEVELLAEFEMN